MTAQVHEILFYKGSKCSMIQFPEIPQGHSRIHEMTEVELVDSNLQDSFVFSTACWRNYIGTWEIKRKKLYIKSINGIYKILGSEPIFADWFTGVLVIPKGKMIQYHHAAWLTEYENYQLIQIENGIVVGERSTPKLNDQ